MDNEYVSIILLLLLIVEATLPAPQEQTGWEKCCHCQNVEALRSETHAKRTYGKIVYECSYLTYWEG